MEQPKLLDQAESTGASPKEAGKGKARVLTANRQQVEMQIAALDSLIPEDHKVRVVWEMTQQYNLAKLYEKIGSIEGDAGRPAIDPHILVAVWLYATSEGIGSAREVARLCEEHVAYRWLVGGVGVNYHTIADFRVVHEEELDQILSESVAALMSEGIVKLERTAQDGVRVRANAGTKSFRRQVRLETLLGTAQEQVKRLKEAGQKEIEEMSERTQAARERAAQERVKRVKKALEEIEKVKQQKAKNHKKKAQRKEERVSTTDPEARVMTMPDGGIRPAYNGEFAVDVESGIVVGVEATNQVDQGQMHPMLDQIKKRYQRQPKEHLVDGGFVTVLDIEDAFQRQVDVYAPLPQLRRAKPPAKPSRQATGPGICAWKERMSTEVAKAIYRKRAARIELVNAQARNRGLQRFLVRGIHKVRSILLWFALTLNLWVAARLKRERALEMI